MGCGCNQTPCTGTPDCTCPVKDLSTDCSTYTGPNLACSGITTNTIMTDLIIALDAFICNKFNEAINYLTLINVGGGAEVYKGISGIGNKQIRTLVSEDDTLVDVIQNTDTIGIRPGTPSLSLNSGTDILSLIITTLAGATVFSTIDLSKYNYDTFVQSASFDDGTQELTIVRNNGEADIVVDLSFLNNSGINVSSGAYATNTITLTLTDASTVTIDLTDLVSEILGAVPAQVKSNYLESNPTSDAYIQNRNPSKTVTLGIAGNYNVVDADNNYIIEINNGVNDVTITVSGVTATTEFFVGFIQKGTGTVTFVGYDIIPELLTDVIFGQGHMSALEIIASTKYILGTLKFA